MDAIFGYDSSSEDEKAPPAPPPKPITPPQPTQPTQTSKPKLPPPSQVLGKVAKSTIVNTKFASQWDELPVSHAAQKRKAEELEKEKAALTGKYVEIPPPAAELLEAEKAKAAEALELLKSEAKRPKVEKEVETFQQKEKRKRDAGQASRAKNYVEEEKRILREAGAGGGFGFD